MYYLKISDEIKKQVVEDYKDGLSGYKIAKKYNIHHSSVYNILKKEKIKTRNNSINSRKYIHNENYFETIDTEHKAYWLGFMYADGYITNTNSFGMSLSVKDKNHIEKFKTDIEATNPIKTYETTVGYTIGNQYVRLLMKSEKTVQDLINHGCVKHKTNILTAPKNVPKHLVHHFIRGYFDGDGCLAYTATTDTYHVKILGTDELLDYIKSYIESNNIAIVNHYYKRKPNQIVSSLEVGGNLQALDFMNHLYKDATICLDRKYERYINLCNKYLVEPTGNVR
jgi:intein-encoded DNA endonuclease-like protein